ncbi:MAG: hypothetical protein GTN36_02515 [Candidatus Aenigmarchaeota archaeon]|nr:hypothetical protein [Candidatus Aenigmarchaeota archaeon]
MNFSFLKKILIIFFLLIFSINANAQTSLKKIDLADMTVEYPQEILIEKGWTKYISISVTNTGESDLYNIKISIEGIFPEWFEFQNNESLVIQINEKVEYVSKISIPFNMPIGNYKFSLNIESDEINYKTDFTVRVFETREDLLLYRVQVLKADLSKLENEAGRIEIGGIDLSSARDIFQQIKSELDLTEEQIYNKMFTQVTESFKEVEKLFIKARFEIENPPKIEVEEEDEIDVLSRNLMFYSSGIGIVLLLVSLIYIVRKVHRENRVRLPNLRLKEIIIESRRIKELEQEIEKIKESQEIIEEEYRGQMLSKESYEEIRLKYQEKLIELEARRRKLRGY